MAASDASYLHGLAEGYVKLVLAVGQHDPAFVDASYGPASWQEEATRVPQTLDNLALRAGRLIEDCAALPRAEEPIVGLRHDYLARQLRAVRTRIAMLAGQRMAFDEESAALYDAVAPVFPESHFQEALDEIDRRLPPGGGSLIERYDRFRQAFIIPTERLAAVFDAAIDEGRRRTKEQVQLPGRESFAIEYVTGKSWSGYNWYQGGYRSLIQVNTDLPIYIDRAIDLACHEGYPGHHVYNVLLEQHLVRERGWVEMTVYALFSPQSLIAEGTANFGIDVAFPGAERLAFERAVLFPAATLDVDRAGDYAAVQAVVDRLGYAGNEAARRYLNGTIDRAEAARWLVRFAMMTPARAEQRVRFFDDYRSYVINYNLGRDLVRQYVESRGGVPDQPARRWEVFIESHQLASFTIEPAMIDAHCHLADDTFEADLDEVVGRAKAAGLERALVVLEAGSEKEARQAARVAAIWPEVRFTIGVHPHAAHEFSGDPQRVTDTVREQIARTPGARAVGEIGLDYHYDYSPRSVQKAVFRAQIRLARELDLPIVVHTREADVDTINLLKEEGKGQVRGVLHCFSGTPALAKAGLDLGLYLSLAGIVTFHRAADLRETAKLVPLDRLLIETDSPFLAPVPYRGKRNEPAYVVQVATALAQIHQTDVSAIAQRTTANFHTLFRP